MCRVFSIEYAACYVRAAKLAKKHLSGEVADLISAVAEKDEGKAGDH